jgi:hypothetical protein
VVAEVSVLPLQSYGRRLRDTVARLEKQCASAARTLVTESAPLAVC